MTFGKLIAWSKESDRGIIEDRLGNTYTVERKDFAEAGVIGTTELDLTFEVLDGTREAYAVESSARGLRRFEAFVGRFIS